MATRVDGIKNNTHLLIGPVKITLSAVNVLKRAICAHKHPTMRFRELAYLYRV